MESKTLDSCICEVCLKGFASKFNLKRHKSCQYAADPDKVKDDQKSIHGGDRSGYGIIGSHFQFEILYQA